jgi:hypothetical protein
MGHYIVFVHGMGEQQPGCSREFGDRLRSAFEDEVQRTGKAKAKSQSFVWEEAYWADITQPDQQKMMDLLKVGDKLRRFMIGYFGDVVAYSKLPYPRDKYGEIQKRFAAAIENLGQQAEQASDEDASLEVIAHSLGSVIASDGIYDLIKSDTMPRNLKLGSFFSMGSPIALFGLRYGLSNFMKQIRPDTWINFHYTKDLVGFPLRPLNAAYESAVNEDVSLSPGGLSFLSTVRRRLVSWLPLAGAVSHSWYCTDRQVIERIAQVLARGLTKKKIAL